MATERTMGGGLRLKPHGCDRYLSGSFLLFWLCGWAAGEGFALWLLVKGGLALLTGRPPDPGREPLHPGPALLAGLFLLLWLALWTVGGVSAFSELLRLWGGEDRIDVNAGRLILIRKRGPFRSTQTFDRNTIRNISLSPREDRLLLDTGRQRIELSRLGTTVERVEGAAALRAQLGIPEEPSVTGTVLPKGWEEIYTPDGGRAVIADRSIRRKQTHTAYIGTLLLAAVTFVVARGSPARRDLIVPAFIMLAFTLALAAGALWLAHGRWEWRIGKQRLTLRKRYGAGGRDVFEARSLLLDLSSDSDGDYWHALYALADPESPPPEVRSVGGFTIQWRPGVPKRSRTIARRMDDAGTVRDLGVWLARETGLRLEDRTTPQARAADLATMRANLATLKTSGRLGRWAATAVDRLSDPRKKSS